MYPMLIAFILGWFGATWWPGIEVDAPKPGSGGDPWWLRPVAGVIAGIGAIIIVQMTHVPLDSLLGVTLGIATGKVVGSIIGAAAGAARK